MILLRIAVLATVIPILTSVAAGQEIPEGSAEESTDGTRKVQELSLIHI